MSGNSEYVFGSSVPCCRLAPLLCIEVISSDCCHVVPTHCQAGRCVYVLHKGGNHCYKFFQRHNEWV